MVEAKSDKRHDGKSRSRAADERTENVTRSQEAYVNIRQDIILGELQASEPLRLDALRRRYGFSYTPLREALQRLQAERLVELSALRGFRVSGISLEEMWDSINTRILIESEGIRLSIEKADDAWEVAVLGAFHSLSRQLERIKSAGPATDRSQLDILEERHWQFHSSLFSGSGSRWLVTLSEQLYAQTERFRRPMLERDGIMGRGERDVLEEHRELMQIVLDRNVKKSASAISDHYRKTGEAVERWMQEHGQGRPRSRQ